MANPEHLAILKQGVDVWNEWKAEKEVFRPDLSGADLSGMNLRRAHLYQTDLNQADLGEADLSYAELSNSYLREADLELAHLIRANLSGAELNNANLKMVNFIEANLFEADLGGADLQGSDLRRANITGADMNGTNFALTMLAHTVFSEVDLSEVAGLDTVGHAGPSTIGIDTIYRSKGKIPEAFLRGAGVPDDFIAYIDSFIAGKAIQYYSCFISHSSKDKPFAQRLHADLQAKGVRCWFAPEDMKIGAPILSEIDQAIRVHDKLLLVLSDNSLQSEWVEHEFLSAENQEVHRKSKILFPVRIDNTVMETKGDWAKRLRERRHIGDFTNWKDHDAYQNSFDRLLRDLQQSAKED